MKRYTKLLGLAAALGMLMSAHPADAQVVHWNTATRMAMFKAFTTGIKKGVAAGKSSKAKVGCLIGYHIIKNSLRVPRFAQRNRAAIADFSSVCDPLYKNHKGDPAGFAAVVAQYKEKITEYGSALAFPPFGKARTNSAGYLSPYKRYQRMVQAPLIGDKAVAYAVEFVGKLPNLDTIVSKPVPGFDPLLAHLMHIMTGKHQGTALIKSKAIPGIIKEADKQIAAFRADWHPDRMTQEAVKVGRWIQLLKQAAPNHAKIPLWTASIKKMKAAAAERWKKFVAKQRMPKNQYSGGDKARVIAAVKASYKASYGRYEKVLRVTIASPGWTPPRGEGWWKNNRWHWGVFSKLGPVVVAVEQKIKGKTMYKMFKFTMKRERNGRSWAKPFMAGNTDHGAPILKKNIFK